MTAKAWVGNAAAAAQVETYSIGQQPPGTSIVATINGKTVSYRSPSGTNDDLITGLLAAWKTAGSTIPEFKEVTPSALFVVPATPFPNGTTLQLTAATPGTPFIVTIALSQPARVQITRAAAGNAGANELQKLVISPNGKTGTFTASFGGDTTTNVPLPPQPLTAAAAGSGTGLAIGTFVYAATFETAVGETEAGAPTSLTLGVANNVSLSSIPLGPTEATARRIYRSKAGTTAPLYLLTTIADNTTTSYTDSTADADLGVQQSPATNYAFEGALQALASVGTNNAKVGLASLPAVPATDPALQVIPSAIVYEIEFVNDLGLAAQSLLTADAFNVVILPTVTITELQAGYPIQNEKQVVGWKQVFGNALPSGYYKITLPDLNVTTAALVPTVIAADVLKALRAAAPPAYLNSFIVTAIESNSNLGALFQIEYADLLANQAIQQATVDASALIASAGDVISGYQKTIQPGSATGQDEQISVTLNNNPTGGTWGINVYDATGDVLLKSATGISATASAGTVQTDLGGATICNVSGSNPYIVTFGGEFGSQQLTFKWASSLTGAGSPSGSPPSTNTTALPPPSGLSATVGNGGVLAANSNYQYAVTATNSAGETTGDFISGVSVSLDGWVSLTWNAVAGATGYKVYRGAGVSPNKLVATISSGSQAKFIDTGVSTATSHSPPGMTGYTPPIDAPVLTSATLGTSGLLTTNTFYYVVTATNSLGETMASNELSAAVPFGSNNDVSLAWGAVSGAFTYKVYRGTSPGGENRLLATTTSTSFIDNGADSATSATLPGSNTTELSPPVLASATGESGFGGQLSPGTYYFVVTAVTAAGETTASNEKSAVISGTFGRVILSWSAVPGALTYKVYRGTTAGGENIEVVNTQFTAYDDGNFSTVGSASPPGSNTTQLSAPVQANASAGTSGALSSNTYYYVVTATNAAGETTASNEKSIAAGPNGDVLVSWAAVTGAEGFKVYRGTSAGSENLLVATITSGSVTSFYDTGVSTATTASPPTVNDTGVDAPTQTTASVSTNGLLAANTYYYIITAFDDIEETIASNEESATTSGSFGAVTLSWSAVGGDVIGYKVYRGTVAGSENLLLATLNKATQTSFVDNGASTATTVSPPSSNTTALSPPVQSNTAPSSSGGNLATETYYYVITALDQYGQTTGSNEKSAVVTGPSGSVVLTWSAVAGATGYKIYRGLSAGDETSLVVTIGDGSTTTYTDVGTGVATSVSVTEITIGREAQTEIQLITLLGVTSGDYQLAANGLLTETIDAAATIATLQADLEEVLGDGNIAVTGGSPSYTATYQGDLLNSPQPLLASVAANLLGSTSATVSRTIIVAGTGPNNWDNDQNWSPIGVPVTGDGATFQNSKIACQYGLQQSGVVLAFLQIDMSYTGLLGLPAFNSKLKYNEYRPQNLEIGVSGQILIGNGAGSGPQLVRLDTGEVPATIQVNNCGSSLDANPAILWKGDRTSGQTTLNVNKGTLGAAVFASETATIDSIVQGSVSSVATDATITLGPGVTITDWVQNGGKGTLNSSIATLLAKAGSIQVFDSVGTPSTIGSLSIQGGKVQHNATGLVTVVVVGTGGTLDRSQTGLPVHFGSTHIFAKSTFLDPNRTISFDTDYILEDCGYEDITIDLGKNISANRAKL